MFGTYENLRDSAKKWTLKLSNMVMQLNNGEEIFTSSLKVDLDFKKWSKTNNNNKQIVIIIKINKI